ncbi:unnamed protein product [Cercopithifilaria johnstoni]|uniref:Glycine cleavage system H protein n=1 Tax=Cercopithifilaria johnstoni TaxID=2874296 RepID=A0A8J2M930_9BILA|nr:unnamed protein product [Cercopithifilaria johnstoni]
MVMCCTRAIQKLFPFVVASESLYIPMYRTIAISQCLFTDRYYTKKHEWVIIEGNTAVVGISDFAQASYGDIVYAELPEVGKELHAGDSVGAVESVKAASDIYSPISGTVTEKNIEVENTPSLINKSALDKGWLFKLKVKDANELKELMNEAAYEAFKKMEEQEAVI